MSDRTEDYHFPGPSHVIGKTIDGKAWRAYWHANPAGALTSGDHEAWIVMVDEREIGIIPGDRASVQSMIERSAKKLLIENGFTPA